MVLVRDLSWLKSDPVVHPHGPNKKKRKKKDIFQWGHILHQHTQSHTNVLFQHSTSVSKILQINPSLYTFPILFVCLLFFVTFHPLANCCILSFIQPFFSTEKIRILGGLGSRVEERSSFASHRSDFFFVCCFSHSACSFSLFFLHLF